MFKIGHSYGERDDMTRQLNGEICEVRIWNVIRSQEEVYKNMYDIVPTTPGLKAYWKFNEGKGTIQLKILQAMEMMLLLIPTLCGQQGLKSLKKIKE